MDSDSSIIKTCPVCLSDEYSLEFYKICNCKRSYICKDCCDVLFLNNIKKCPLCRLDLNAKKKINVFKTMNNFLYKIMPFTLLLITKILFINYYVYNNSNELIEFMNKNFIYNFYRSRKNYFVSTLMLFMVIYPLIFYNIIIYFETLNVNYILYDKKRTFICINWFYNIIMIGIIIIYNKNNSVYSIYLLTDLLIYVILYVLLQIINIYYYLKFEYKRINIDYYYKYSYSKYNNPDNEIRYNTFFMENLTIGETNV